MMKKLGLLAFVMALVVAFALPAFAYTVEGAKGERFTIGGSVYFDIGYRNTNKDYNTNTAPGYGGKDNTKIFLADTYNSNLNGNFTIGNAGFTWVFYVSHDLGAAKDYTGVNAGYVNYRDYVGSDVWYGTYKFGNCTLTAGKQAGAINTFGMSQTLGYTASVGSHIIGIGKGHVYDYKFPQLRFRQDISKQFAYHIALIAPGTAGETVGASTVNSYSTLPTLAVKLILNFGAVSLYPAVGIQQLQWEGLPAGYDTSVTGWVAKLPLQVVAGPFTGKFEVTYGQNLGGSHGTAGWFAESAYGGYQRNAAGKVLNGNTLGGFFDLAFTFGPITPHIYYGQVTNSNSDYYTVGDNSNTRKILGANASYYVTPNFIIKPEVFMTDYGTKPGDAAKPKLGGEWLAGVEFIFSF